MGRLFRFRNELIILWRAFMATGTPVWLKALMLLVPAYLLSPIDIIPDFVPVLGWVDDIIVIPLLVSWLVGLLPVRSTSREGSGDRAPVIDGDWRRM